MCLYKHTPSHMYIYNSQICLWMHRADDLSFVSLEVLVLKMDSGSIKCPYYPRLSIDSMKFLLKY